MGLHGVITPEEKRRREDKQKRYARELDEQVGLIVGLMTVVIIDSVLIRDRHVLLDGHSLPLSAVYVIVHNMQTRLRTTAKTQTATHAPVKPLLAAN